MTDEKTLLFEELNAIQVMVEEEKKQVQRLRSELAFEIEQQGRCPSHNTVEGIQRVDFLSILDQLSCKNIQASGLSLSLASGSESRLGDEQRSGVSTIKADEKSRQSIIDDDILCLQPILSRLVFTSVLCCNEKIDGLENLSSYLLCGKVSGSNSKHFLSFELKFLISLPNNMQKYLQRNCHSIMNPPSGNLMRVEVKFPRSDIELTNLAKLTETNNLPLFFDNLIAFIDFYEKREIAICSISSTLDKEQFEVAGSSIKIWKRKHFMIELSWTITFSQYKAPFESLNLVNVKCPENFSKVGRSDLLEELHDTGLNALVDSVGSIEETIKLIVSKIFG